MSLKYFPLFSGHIVFRPLALLILIIVVVVTVVVTVFVYCSLFFYKVVICSIVNSFQFIGLRW